jgi:hypothetical protein
VVVEVAETIGTKDEDQVGLTDAGVAQEEEGCFEVPVGSVVERVEAFSQWAHRRLDPGELVLLDENVLLDVAARMVLPVPVMLPPDQLSASVMVTVPLPPKVPLEKVKDAMVAVPLKLTVPPV